jgi:hypothetical protein
MQIDIQTDTANLIGTFLQLSVVNATKNYIRHSCYEVIYNVEN